MTNVAFDTETGGIHPHKHPLLQIGAVADIVDESSPNGLKSISINFQADPEACMPKALEVNKINLEEHNDTAMTTKDGIAVFADWLSEVATSADKRGVRPLAWRAHFDHEYVRCSEVAAERDLADEKLFNWFQLLDLRAVWIGRYGAPPRSLGDGFLTATGKELVGAHDATNDAYATLAIGAHLGLFKLDGVEAAASDANVTTTPKPSMEEREPSQKQIGYLRFLGYDGPAPTSMAEASVLIDERVSKK